MGLTCHYTRRVSRARVTGVVVAAFVAVTLLTLAAPRRARAGGADELAEAERRKATLDWAGALAAVDRALAAGDGTPASVARAHQLAGELAAGLGQRALAVAHFEQWLAIEPAGALRAGASPKITTPFEQARARVATLGSLRVVARAGAAGVVVAVDSDPFAMVAAVRARWLDDRGVVGSRQGDGPAPWTLAIPAGARQVEVDALDGHGNVLWTGAVATRGVVDDGDDRPGRPVWARWKPWASVSALGLVVGGVFAWRLDAAQDEWNRLRAEPGAHDFSALVAVEDRGRRHALVANLAFGAAAASAIVAIVWGVRAAGEPPRDRGVGVLRIEARGDGVSVGLGGRF